MQAVGQYQTDLVIPTGATSGARIVISGSSDAVFVYDSNNNLIASVAASAGTDASGNFYPEGISSIDPTRHEISNILNGIYYSGFEVAGSFDYSHAAWFGANSNGSAELATPFTAPNAGVVFLWSEASNVTTGPDANSASWQIQATQGAVYASILGALVGGDNVNGAATWQIPTLNAGWATDVTAGGVQQLKYRITNEDELEIVGAFHSTSATPSSTVFTVSGIWLPKALQRPNVVQRASGVSAPNNLTISSSTGNVGLLQAITATSTDVYTYVRTPLGNIP